MSPMRTLKRVQMIYEMLMGKPMIAQTMGGGNDIEMGAMMGVRMLPGMVCMVGGKIDNFDLRMETGMSIRIDGQSENVMAVRSDTEIGLRKNDGMDDRIDIVMRVRMDNGMDVRIVPGMGVWMVERRWMGLKMETGMRVRMDARSENVMAARSDTGTGVRMDNGMGALMMMDMMKTMVWPLA